MFGLKKHKYRQTVETNLSYLVGLNENYFQKLYRSFDGVIGVIDDAGKAGRDPMDLAVELWGIMFSYEIERTPTLVENGESIIEYIKTGGKNWRWDTELAMRVFLVQADKQHAVGSITDATVKFAFSEVLGALQGIPRDERSARRMASLLDETLFAKPEPSP